MQVIFQTVQAALKVLIIKGYSAVQVGASSVQAVQAAFGALIGSCIRFQIGPPIGPAFLHPVPDRGAVFPGNVRLLPVLIAGAVVPVAGRSGRAAGRIRGKVLGAVPAQLEGETGAVPLFLGIKSAYVVAIFCQKSNGMGQLFKGGCIFQPC